MQIYTDIYGVCMCVWGTDTDQNPNNPILKMGCDADIHIEFSIEESQRAEKCLKNSTFLVIGEIKIKIT